MVLASSRWAARGLKIRLLVRAILVFCVVLALFDAVKFLEVRAWPWNDYFAWYSFSYFIRTNPAALIYDNAALECLQSAMHGPMLPYLYDPAFLLLIAPLSRMPYVAGMVLWALLGWLAFFLSVGLPERNRAVGIVALVAPSTIWTALCGQSSLFAAALLFGGFRLLPRRPVLAGLLFGLLTFKPQLGLLVPVALVAAGQWKCLAAGAVSAGMFMTASLATFGGSVWVAWLHHLLTLGQALRNIQAVFGPAMVTVSANLLVLGAPPAVAHIVQIIAAIASCLLVWLCFRKGISVPGVAVVAVGTFLTTPYAFGYDMPLVAGAIIVVGAERYRRQGSFTFPEIMILLTAFLLPLCSVFFCISSLVMAALLWVVAREILTPGLVDASAPRPMAVA